MRTSELFRDEIETLGSDKYDAGESEPNITHMDFE